MATTSVGGVPSTDRLQVACELPVPWKITAGSTAALGTNSSNDIAIPGLVVILKSRSDVPPRISACLQSGCAVRLNPWERGTLMLFFESVVLAGSESSKPQ